MANPRIRISTDVDVDLEDTMVFEEEYHENLKLSLEDKEAISDKWIVNYLSIIDPENNETLIGETYGLELGALEEFETEPIEDCDDYEDEEKDSIIYCYSTTILKPYQNKGYGKLLKSFWLGNVFGTGYTKIIGHCKQGPSTDLNLFFGAKMLTERPDWYKTGLAYNFYELELV